MRNLTIKRNKTFVGCLGKFNVYIEDDQNYDLIINNSPCRKLGTLKNGEEKTFEISESSARVYVIADKLSKGYCNEFAEIPYGEEDVALTGRSRFNPATGNAFRFDGEVSEEVIANRKKGSRRGIVVLAIAIIIGVMIGGVIGGYIGDAIFESNEYSVQKDFTASDMTVTLTEDFYTESYQGYELVCESKKVVLFALCEKFSLYPVMKDWTVDNYTNIVKQNAGAKDTQYADGLTYFEYDAVNGTDYHYYAFVYKTDDAFWFIQFATAKADAEAYEAKIMKWAKSVKFD